MDRNPATAELLADQAEAAVTAAVMAAASVVELAVSLAADGAAVEAHAARGVRGAAAATQAQAMADTAAHAALAVQELADAAAAKVAGAAADAAADVALTDTSADKGAALTAARVAAIVRAAAIAEAERTAAAAAVVARAVAAAAADAAYTESSVAIGLEIEVSKAATAMRAVAAAAAREVADQSTARAIGVARAAREAAAAELLALSESIVSPNPADASEFSPAVLARRLSEIARSLQFELSSADLIHAIVKAAVDTVPGAEYAGITMVSKHGEVTTPARSDDLVRELDGLQNTARAGPCVTAPAGNAAIHIDDLTVDKRWPAFGAGAARAGVRSMLSIPLFVQERRLGALNVYAGSADAFNAESEDVGRLLADHASLAMASIEREVNLRTALSSRDVIGQAKGILMERQKIGEDAAFRLLVQASQATNRKVTAIAELVSTTGLDLTSDNLRGV